MEYLSPIVIANIAAGIWAFVLSHAAISWLNETVQKRIKAARLKKLQTIFYDQFKT